MKPLKTPCTMLRILCKRIQTNRFFPVRNLQAPQVEKFLFGTKYIFTYVPVSQTIFPPPRQPIEGHAKRESEKKLALKG